MCIFCRVYNTNSDNIVMNHKTLRWDIRVKHKSNQIKSGTGNQKMQNPPKKHKHKFGNTTELT